MFAHPLDSGSAGSDKNGRPISAKLARFRHSSFLKVTPHARSGPSTRKLAGGSSLPSSERTSVSHPQISAAVDMNDLAGQIGLIRMRKEQSRRRDFVDMRLSGYRWQANAYG